MNLLSVNSEILSTGYICLPCASLFVSCSARHPAAFIFLRPILPFPFISVLALFPQLLSVPESQLASLGPSHYSCRNIRGENEMRAINCLWLLKVKFDIKIAAVGNRAPHTEVKGEQG